MGRLPTSPQEPGPRTKCRTEASLGHRVRSPQPGGRRSSPSGEQGRVASPSAAAAQLGLASPALQTPIWAGAPRPPSAPGSAGPRPRPCLLSGSPWSGAKSAGLDPRRRTVWGSRRRSHRPKPLPTHDRRSPQPPPQPQPAPVPPGPARSAPSPRARATPSCRGCQGERAARRREGARSAPRMRVAAGPDRAGGVGGRQGAARRRERPLPGPAGPLKDPLLLSPSLLSPARAVAASLNRNGPLGIQQPGGWGERGKESSGSGRRSASFPSHAQPKHLTTRPVEEQPGQPRPTCAVKRKRLGWRCSGNTAKAYGNLGRLGVW